MHGDRKLQAQTPRISEEPQAVASTQAAVSTVKASPDTTTAFTFERRLDARLILAVIATGLMTFAGVVVETTMNVAFPTLMEQFDIGTSTVQWATTGYMLVLAAVIPTSAFLNRRVPTRPLFIIAALLFIVGLIIDFLAPSFAILLVGRLVQGVGTGIALPLMYNIVIEQAPQRNMGFMMSVAMLIVNLAPALGPALGGFVIDHLGWRMVFAGLLPFMALSLVLGAATIRQSHETGPARFDAAGWVVLVISFACLVLATSLSGTRGWTDLLVIGLLVGFAVMLALFCVREMHAIQPLIDLKVFRYSGFNLSVAVIFLLQFVCLGLIYLMTNYSQIVGGTGATIAGSLLLPGWLVGAVVTPLAGRALDRYGAKKPILLGNSLVVACAGIFTILSAVGAHSASFVITTGMFVGIYVLYALGDSFTAGNTTTNGLAHLPIELRSDGNAVMNTVMQLAGATGTSIVTAIVGMAEATYPGNAIQGMEIGCSHAYLLLVILAALMLLCSAAVFAGDARRKHAVADQSPDRSR